MKQQRNRWIAAALACGLLLAGCGTADSGQDSTGVTQSGSAAAAAEPVSREIFAMDTYMTVTAYGEPAQEAVDAAVSEIQRLDALLSIGESGSEISMLNDSGTARVSDDTGVMIDKALELYRDTGGAFDLTILPLMETWGFTDEAYRVPSEEELKTVLQKIGADQLTWDKDSGTIALGEGQKMDLGGIAKGYTSSRIMEIFEQYGVTSGMVSLGGNVHLLGTKPDGTAWRVGIQDPENSAGMLGILETQDCAVITSGGYERYFEQDGKRYHHILDPTTGKPADSGITSVTIVSEDGTLADGLSTALFVMGVEKASDYWKQHADTFDAVIVAEDGTIYATEGIVDSLSCETDITVLRQDGS